jgi:hypothetical protein
MSFTTTGVTPDQIGPVYDLAMGRIDSTGNAEMVGYVLTPSSGWNEATNLQDEEHLVQVDSPFSTDRFGRYPKVSQGDWSGGERQLIFVNGNQYYQSQQLETAIPGHLTCMGNYLTVSVPAGVFGSGASFGGGGLPRIVSSAASDAFFVGNTESATYKVTALNLSTLVQTTFAVPGNVAVSELMHLPNGLYVATTAGLYQLAIGTSTWTQVTDDDVADANLIGASMAYLEGSIYYLLSTASGGVNTGGEMMSATYPFPGASAGTQVLAGYEFENLLLATANTGTGLAVVAGSAFGATRSWVYTFDGAVADFVGVIEGGVLDVCEANGVVYILTVEPHYGTSPPVFGLPIIYQLDGSTLSIFDDYRSLDPDFLPTSTQTYGHLDQDGRYLYYFTGNLNTKRYNLTTAAVTDVGNPTAATAIGYWRAGTVLSSGTFAEIAAEGAGTTAYICQAHVTPNTNGWMITSWYDFGTPGVDKSFTQIEFTFNAPTDATSLNAVTLQFQVNNPTATWTSAAGALAQNSNDVIFTLPYPTIGSRIRFQITLVAAEAPDIQSYSISATLARTWTVTVSCRRGQSVRNGAPGRDPQNLTSTQLLANIKQCYRSGGNVVLYMPDPTIDEAAVAANLGPAVGVAQCFAVLQDYSWTTANTGVSPAYRTDATPPGIEGDAVLTLTEALG